MSMARTAVELDVVIPTRDRPELLAACLKALARQSFPQFGVIVVDDAGATPAEALVPEALRDALGVRFVRNQVCAGPGPSRNRGVAASQAQFIVFLDDDCIAAPELIARHRNALTSAAGPVVSLGPIIAPPGQRLSVWNHWDADRLEREYQRLSSGQSRPGWQHLFTGNVGLRRADFLAVGGFDESFARQEDIELGSRLAGHGGRFVFDRAALVWHDSSRSLRGWMNIAAASAQFDVEFDPAASGPGGEPVRTTHWALRVTRRIAAAPLAHRCAIIAAMAAGFVLHAVRVDRMALAAFSVVRDLTYYRALRETRSGVRVAA